MLEGWQFKVWLKLNIIIWRVLMLAIILMFVVIAVVVSFLVIVYYKYIKISDNWARKLEILGYILLFIVFVWEFIVKNLLMENFYNADWYYLNQRLYYMFLMLRANLGIGAINAESVIEGFQNAVQTEYVQNQMLCVNVIESILQILSTIFIAIGRFQEIKKDK